MSSTKLEKNKFAPTSTLPIRGHFVNSRLEKLWERHYSSTVFVAFWLIGFCNSFPFLVMISAAHDFLSSSTTTSRRHAEIATVNAVGIFANGTAISFNRYDCNKLSTGVVLLVDVLPGILLKLTVPFFASRIKYWKRVAFTVATSAASFLLVAYAPPAHTWLIFVGVVCASVSNCFGEITYLSLTTQFPTRPSLAGWASGTGACGLFSSFIYAGLTSLGLSMQDAMLAMLFVPVLMTCSYSILPTLDYATRHRSKAATAAVAVVNADAEKISIMTHSNTIMPTLNNSDELACVSAGGNRSEMVNSVSAYVGAKTIDTFSGKLKAVRSLIKYMLILFIVYFADYFINQGLFELLYFKDNSIINGHALQYRWYNVMFRLGVFISKSAISFLKIEWLFIFPILQLANVIILFSQVIYGFMPSILIVLGIIFWEGLIGGSCYVNALHKVSTTVTQNAKEFSISIITVSDTAGIALAGFIAIPVHNMICRLGTS